MRLMMPSPRQSTAALSLLLSLLVILSAASPIPLVSISSVQGLDEGAEVRVLGVVADLRRFDSGTEAIILVDLGDGCSISVYCTEGIGSRPGDYIKVGDELAVVGAVVRSDGLASLLSSPSQVTLSRVSAYVLTPDLLSENWVSFVGDDLSIRGRIVQDPFLGDVRLSDRSGDASVALRSDSTDLSFYVGFDVVLAGELTMDPLELSLFISVEWVSLQQ